MFRARKSIRLALNGALPTLVTSGSILVIAGLLIGFISTESIISVIGLVLGRGTIISLLLVLFVLPQMLVWGDRFISRTTVKGRRLRLHPLFDEDFEQIALRDRARKGEVIPQEALGGNVFPQEKGRYNEKNTVNDHEHPGLAASSVFGIIAAGRGSDELSDIMRFKRGQKADIIDFVDVLDKRVADLRKAEENRTEDEKDYTESVVTDQKGNEQLSQGTQEYNAGAAKIAAGQAEYDAAEKQYNEKLAEYRRQKSAI